MNDKGQDKEFGGYLLEYIWGVSEEKATGHFAWCMLEI